MLGCESAIVAACSSSSALGVYVSTTGTSAYGGITSGPPPSAASAKLDALARPSGSTRKRSGSASAVGLERVNACCAAPPTGHESRGSSVGSAASASRRSSYQNSPAVGWTNATEPWVTPATSGE